MDQEGAQTGPRPERAAGTCPTGKEVGGPPAGPPQRTARRGCSDRSWPSAHACLSATVRGARHQHTGTWCSPRTKPHSHRGKPFLVGLTGPPGPDKDRDPGVHLPVCRPMVLAHSREAGGLGCPDPRSPVRAAPHRSAGMWCMRLHQEPGTMPSYPIMPTVPSRPTDQTSVQSITPSPGSATGQLHTSPTLSSFIPT